MTARAGRAVAVRSARHPSGAATPHDDRVPSSEVPSPSTVHTAWAPVGPVSSGLGRIPLDDLLDRLRSDGFPHPGAVVIGGGCAGLALAVSIADSGGAVVVAEARRGDRDERTWCYWDTGQSVLPEAVSHSWARWEVRAAGTSAVAGDADHPYRMVRADDYRAAARARLEAAPGARLIDGVHVVDALAPRHPDPQRPRLFDARGPLPTAAVPAGRVLLHQRFVGLWIRTGRPVFDDTTATLMDFPEQQGSSGARFFYVLPVAPDLALVELTVFSRDARGAEPFQQHIADYVGDRWGLRADEWSVAGREAGSIPMTDARPRASERSGVPLGLRAGIARPSTGYAFTRMQIAARRAAAALQRGADEARIHDDRPRDPRRTRMLDAIFLRFLRDQPERAPEVFLRMFGRLPGPLTVRFLTERSHLLDDLRLVLVLPKTPFLRAAATTAIERIGALAAPGRRP